MTLSELNPSPELRVCSVVRALVGWDRVSVVAADGLDHRLDLSGSDEVLRYWGDLQQSVAEGPGADVLATGVPVLVDDVRSRATPWAVLRAATAADVPVRSVAVLPLVAPGGGAVVGVLCVARDVVAPFTGAQVALLSALAALLAVVVTHRLSTGELLDGDGSSCASAPGDVVAVVVGMLTVRLGAGADEALARLRAYAFVEGSTIHEVARAVTAGRVDLAEIAGKP